MKIISQNLANYDFPLPSNSIFRINLAWCNSLDELNSILNRHKEFSIFLDLPAGRIKPPNNKYSLDDLIPIINKNKQIKYFAISNVNSASDLSKYLTLMPSSVIIVPKIESPKGIENIQEITDILKGDKIVMLDHDDLFSSILKNKMPESKFKDYIKKIVNYCDTNDIKLLRVAGIIFTDEEKHIKQYVK